MVGGTLAAPGGRIELGSVDNGAVSLTPTTSGWILGYQAVPSFSDIQFSGRSLADTSGVGSGSIQVQGAHVKLMDGSVILNQNQGLQPGGSLSVNASDSLEVIGTPLDKPTPNSLITTSLANETVGGGSGGNIEISTKKLLVQDGGAIKTRTFATARGGDLIIKAPESVTLTGLSPGPLRIPSEIISATYGSKNGGNFTLSTGSLAVLGGAEIVSATYRFSVTLSRRKLETRIYSGLWNSTREEVHQSN